MKDGMPETASGQKSFGSLFKAGIRIVKSRKVGRVSADHAWMADRLETVSPIVELSVVFNRRESYLGIHVLCSG